MMKRNKVVMILVLTLVAGVLFWSLVFRLSINEQRGREVVKNDYTDSLSGEEISKESINNVQYVNPWAPYFIGFDSLDFYGVTDDSKRYIQDFITNFVLENKQDNPAIVSLVKDSFDGPFISDEGYKTEYSFEFGINEKDVHSLKAVNSGRDDSITITVLKDNEQIANRKFTLHRLSDLY